RFGTVATAIAHMKRNDLARGRVHGDPHPLLVGFLLHETPQLIGLSFELAQDDIRRALWTLTCRSSGQAAKRCTIKCNSQVRLTPTARQIPRSEMRSNNKCSTIVRCASVI